jgi:hypothetical protein
MRVFGDTDGEVFSDVDTQIFDAKSFDCAGLRVFGDKSGHG